MLHNTTTREQFWQYIANILHLLPAGRPVLEI